MHLLRESDGKPVALGEPLGRGGEARIYRVIGEATLAAKVYHHPTPEQGRKLAVMLATPPVRNPAAGSHASIAWPLELLRTPAADRPFAGFLMPAVEAAHQAIEFYNPSLRRRRHHAFDYSYLHRAAQNLAAAVHTMHASGHIVGDINESNMLVTSTALVTLVDTDSFQVRDPIDGRVYRCVVGKPEYTPPELQGRSFREFDRTSEHDRFGLAVLLFQLLMEGTHPFAGRSIGPDSPGELAGRIAAGCFPYGGKRGPHLPPTAAPSFELLNPSLRELFVDCFVGGHHLPARRPDARAWQQALRDAEDTLTACRIHARHRYGGHLTRCPWCKRMQHLDGSDAFPRQGLTPAQPARPRPASSPVTPPRPTPAVPAPRPLQPPRFRLPAPPWRVLAGLAAGAAVLFVLLNPGRFGFNSAPAPVPPGVATQVNPIDGAAMIQVPAAEFTMGSTAGIDDEKPAHEVRFTKSFWLYRTLVTHAQYGTFLAANAQHAQPKYWTDSRFDAPQQPVVGVTWNDAAAYCRWAECRLPTEAEWEYAARGPGGSTYPWGEEFPDASRAVLDPSGSAPVGSKPTGASWCGALDMAGHWWQWCADWYGTSYYENSPAVDPRGPADGAVRVVRGGSWGYSASDLRSAVRYGVGPEAGRDFLGFRAARTMTDSDAAPR